MKIGEKYTAEELIQLLGDSEFNFLERDVEEIPSEPNRPRWHRTVKNAVRNSPSRTTHNQNWWLNLRAEEIDNKWKYWLVEEENGLWSIGDKGGAWLLDESKVAISEAKNLIKQIRKVKKLTENE